MDELEEGFNEVREHVESLPWWMRDAIKGTEPKVSDSDAINDLVVAEEPRLGYPSRHDWFWMGMDKNYYAWLDAAYPTINRLAKERDEARSEVRAWKDLVNTLCGVCRPGKICQYHSDMLP